MDSRTKRALERPMDEGLRLALMWAGSYSQLSRYAGLTSTSAWNWKRIPAEHILEIEKNTGIPREKLRPDLYRR